MAFGSDLLGELHQHQVCSRVCSARLLCNGHAAGVCRGVCVFWGGLLGELHKHCFGGTMRVLSDAFARQNTLLGLSSERVLASHPQSALPHPSHTNPDFANTHTSCCQAEEFELRARAGVPPAELIAAATDNCARLFGLEVG